MSAFALKIIAFISMAIHHAEMTNLFSQMRLIQWFGMGIPESARLMEWISAIDRLAFPIFAFLIAEGCRHTKNRRNYLLRLLIFAVISELPFDMLSAHTGPTDPFSCFSPFSHLNVFFTHSLGVAGIIGFEYLTKKGVRRGVCVLAMLPYLLIAEFLQTDYLLPGVLLIWAAYFPKTRAKQIVSMMAVLAFLYLLHNYRYSFPIDISQWKQFFASCAALIPIACYNGKRGRRCKWTFYIAYPVHIALFVAISLLLG